MRNFHKFLGGSLSKYSLCFMLRAIFICYLKNHWRLSDQGRDLCPVKEIKCFVALEDIGRNSALASSKEENIDLLRSKNGFQMRDSKGSVCGTCRNYSAVNKRVHLLISPSRKGEVFRNITFFCNICHNSKTQDLVTHKLSGTYKDLSNQLFNLTRLRLLFRLTYFRNVWCKLGRKKSLSPFRDFRKSIQAQCNS